MNPLSWKREHQVALLVAAVVGAFAVTTFMFRTISHCAARFTGSTEYYPVFGIHWGPFLAECGILIIGWPIVGAIFGAAIVYVHRLLRV